MAQAADVSASSQPVAERVIATTKLHVPAVREGLVSRDSLVRHLAAGAVSKLTLLDAPAGSGKTTLLAEWSAFGGERPFAWLTLDEEDNDPVRFWDCAIESLRTVQPGLGERARGALEARNISLLDIALPLLVNELAALESGVVLVLDDYHVIRDQELHASVGYLLDHLPANVHLALATRFDPPLPLARLRAQGEMTEIRAAELRFTDEEALELLGGALGLDLDPADVARLQQRTEGWAAGLYLVALSLRGRDDTREFIDSFAGDDRQIVDYLSSEVLAGQPEELHDFLLRTSILERLSGPLCDAVTGGEGGAQTLERMERFNLFVVPLDTTRDWYRYHHLFGELLRHELTRERPGLVPELHKRASAWYRELGSIAEAIHHATAGHDVYTARDLIARHWNGFFNQGRLATVAGWLDALPHEAVTAEARLCVARAWLALDRGQADEAERWIVAAERDAGSMQSDAAVLRAVHSLKVGDPGRAQLAALDVLELGPHDVSFSHFVAHCILGAARYWRREVQDAVVSLEEAVRLARAGGNRLGESYALGYLALCRADLGDPEEAGRLAREATGLSEDAEFVEHFATMMGWLARGIVGERSGRPEEAERAIERALELARRGAGELEIACAKLALARVRQSLRGGRTTRGRNGATSEELTDRELSVLRLLKSDLSRREIGEALYVSPNTVKTHVRGIYRKLDAATRDEAISRARELGLL